MHSRARAEQIRVMLVSNYPGKRGEAFGLELIRRLCDEVPGVMALKDDVGGTSYCPRNPCAPWLHGISQAWIEELRYLTERV